MDYCNNYNEDRSTNHGESRTRVRPRRRDRGLKHEKFSQRFKQPKTSEAHKISRSSKMLAGARGQSSANGDVPL